MAQPQPKAANGADERGFIINEAGTATLRSVVARDLVWQFNVIPDRPRYSVGDTATVIRSHNEVQPDPVRLVNKKVPKRVARVLMSALEKEVDKRPQTAIAFSHAMRANVDGLSGKR